MRPIPEGYEAVFETVVTPEMTVHFEELGPVHPVYATYWMVKHMELAGRKIILPFLEEGEEGIGSYVEVRHLASALPGMHLPDPPPRGPGPAPSPLFSLASGKAFPEPGGLGPLPPGLP